VLLFGSPMKTPLAVAARGGSGKRRSAGASRRGVRGVVVMGIPVRGSDERPNCEFSPRANTTQRGGSRPVDCLETLYAFTADGASLHGHEGQPPVDSVVDASYAGFMNLQVPPELEAKLTRLATETGRSVDQVALELLASSIDHDEWFRDEVEKGRTAAREGRLLEHDDVAVRMDRRYRG